MSAPLYNGGFQVGLDAGGQLCVLDDGNWSLQGTSEQPEFRALAVFVDGLFLSGYPFPPQREPFALAILKDGVFTRPGLLAWRGPKPEPGKLYTLYLEAGNRYLGWGDTAGEDWMEWGAQDPSDSSKTITVFDEFTLSAPPPPDPPPPSPRLTLESNEQEAIAVLYKLVEQWRGAGRTDAEIFDTLHYQIIRALASTGPNRAVLKDLIRRALA